jgi:hypothetical protein
MKRTIVTVLATLAVVAFVMVAVGPKAQRVGTTTVVAAPAPAAAPMPNPCPGIHTAIDQLQTAYKEMENAGHGFCGYRVRAMQAVRNATEELQMAEKYAKCQ